MKKRYLVLVALLMLLFMPKNTFAMVSTPSVINTWTTSDGTTSINHSVSPIALSGISLHHIDYTGSVGRSFIDFNLGIVSGQYDINFFLFYGNTRVNEGTPPQVMINGHSCNIYPAGTYQSSEYNFNGYVFTEKNYASSTGSLDASLSDYTELELQNSLKYVSSMYYVTCSDVDYNSESNSLSILTASGPYISASYYGVSRYFYYSKGINSQIIEGQKENTEAIKEQTEEQQKTNDKLDKSEETRKGIWETIKELPSKFLDMLLGLFIPGDMSFLDNFRESLENKLGFIAEVPLSILDFLINLVSSGWNEFNSITLPSIEVFGVSFWNSQDISLQEAIDIFSPYKYVSDVICVVLCVNTLRKWYESFASGGVN